MKHLPNKKLPNVVIGFDHNEDASVYDMGDYYLVQTLDIFGACHPDPFVFGQIAAANSLSDVFAMGGTVLYAQNILCVPDQMDGETTAEVLKGAMERMDQIGSAIVGGHTVSNTELIYGLSVTGKVEKDELLTNDGAKENQAIILTKKIGTGVYNKFIKGANNTPDVEEVIQSMISLNYDAARVAIAHGASAVTDVTGFGLGGHLIEVLEASNLSCDLVWEDIPKFEKTMEYANLKSGGMNRNIWYFASKVSENLTEEEFNILFDPQTSGGLLLFVDQDEVNAVLKSLHEVGVTAARKIGVTKKASTKAIDMIK